MPLHTVADLNAIFGPEGGPLFVEVALDRYAPVETCAKRRVMAVDGEYRPAPEDALGLPTGAAVVVLSPAVVATPQGELPLVLDHRLEALEKLAERVAALNPVAGEIGDGMLWSLVDDARRVARGDWPAMPLYPPVSVKARPPIMGSGPAWLWDAEHRASGLKPWEVIASLKPVTTVYVWFATGDRPEVAPADVWNWSDDVEPGRAIIAFEVM